MGSPIARPPIMLSRSDRATVERAAMQGLLQAPRVAGALLDEIRRAQVVDDEDLGPHIVRLGSIVTFREAPDGEARTVRLVGQEDVGHGPEAVSVFTGLGAGLLGLEIGQSIQWPDRVGGEQVLTITGIRQAPSRRGGDAIP